VTELVTGLDLVAWQIRIAAGERLPDEVLAAEPRGHAIEARVYAEDPHHAFAPVAGSITAWRMASGPGVRVDTGIDGPAALPIEYDPLLAKIMVHSDGRPAAIARLRRALDETLIGGVQTDLSFLRWLADEPGFEAGSYDSGLVDQRWGKGPELGADERSLAAWIASEARGRSSRGASNGLPTSGEGGWASLARREAVDRRRPR
jgi:acetyl/propionyl-CoA carboxylase alpha subunit